MGKHVFLRTWSLNVTLRLLFMTVAAAGATNTRTTDVVLNLALDYLKLLLLLFAF